MTRSNHSSRDKRSFNRSNTIVYSTFRNKHNLVLSFSTTFLQRYAPQRFSLFLFLFFQNQNFTFGCHWRKVSFVHFSGWETAPEDVPSTHSIHNLVNEQCWKRILEWEQLHSQFITSTSSHSHPSWWMWLVFSFSSRECNQPKLESFHGRPKDFSPKARLKHFFGWAFVH